MFALTVEDTFRITGRGVVATGRIASGSVSVGDTVLMADTPLTVKGVEAGRQKVDHAAQGDVVGLLFDGSCEGLQAGVQLTGTGTAQVPAAPASPAVQELQAEVGLGDPPPKRRGFLRSKR